MKVVNYPQRSSEWHDWRRNGVTASDVPALMGCLYKTPWRIWAEKRGLVLPEYLDGNPNVERGIRFEPVARRRFEERHDTLLLPLCAESTEEPIVRASFDGIDDDGCPAELKAPCESKFREALAQGKQSEMYQRYYGQVQTQIYVSEADKGYLTLDIGTEYLDFVIPRDPRYIDQLVNKARELWELILTGKEPPMDPSRDLYVPAGMDKDKWLLLAADYRQNEAKRAAFLSEIKSLEEKMESTEQQFLSMMGEFCIGESAGVRVNRYVRSGSVDYKRIVEDIRGNVPEIIKERYRRDSVVGVRITVRGDEDKRTVVPFNPEDIQRVTGINDWF